MVEKLAFFSILLVVGGLAACSPNESVHTYSIEGVVHGVPDSLPIYLRDALTNQDIDSAVVTDSTFSFSGSVQYPKQLRLIYDGPLVSYSHEVWVEDGKTTVRAHWEDMYNVQVAGGVQQQLADEVNAEMETWEAEHELPFYNPFLYDLDEEKLNELMNYRLREQTAHWLPLVLRRANSYYGVMSLFQRRDNIKRPVLEAAFAAMDPQIQKSPYGKGLKQYLEQDTLGVGDRFVDFPLVNLAGESVRLSDYVGKDRPTLLVFGALGHIRQYHRDLIGAMQYQFGDSVNVLGYNLAPNMDMFLADTAWYHGVPLVTDFERELSPMVIQYDAIQMPMVYVFDEKGVIRLRSQEYSDEAHALALRLSAE